MGRLWYDMIRKGVKDFSECPEKYLDEVFNYIQLDYEAGIISQEQYNKYMTERK